ncbi:MAG: hypothetical protein IKN45_00020, partial [Lachnospiraceae bacterium]|nr:hypothetical protein [Lachnospiraceae bacterium]
MAKVVVMDHPLIQHKIGYIRRIDTGTKDFRDTIGEIAMLICYEATRDLELEEVEIETPICKTTVKELKGKKLILKRDELEGYVFKLVAMNFGASVGSHSYVYPSSVI